MQKIHSKPHATKENRQKLVKKTDRNVPNSTIKYGETAVKRIVG